MKSTQESMSYFKTRMRQLRSEYTKADRKEIIAAAGGRCAMCNRRDGDEYIFGPTNYLKKKLKFKVYIDIHVIEGTSSKAGLVVLCCGCHSGYHLFNRLSEDAEFGVPLSSTVFQRCGICSELKESCMCCTKCGKASKWCRCPTGAKRKKRKH